MAERLKAWGFTVPGIMLFLVATVAFFMGKLGWAEYSVALGASGFLAVAK